MEHSDEDDGNDDEFKDVSTHQSHLHQNGISKICDKSGQIICILKSNVRRNSRVLGMGGKVYVNSIDL